MEDNIKNQNLLRILKLKLCTTPAKKYTDIENIDISNKNLMGNNLDIDLTEIIKLSNLKTVSLKFFKITDDVIDSINKLEKLYKIEFYMCEFKTKRTLNKKIIDITIYCCKDFSKEILDKSTNIERLELTNSGLVDMNDLQIFKDLKLIKIRDCSLISLPKISSLDKLEYIYLNNLDIQYDFDISKMNNLKLISLNGSKFINKESYIQNLKEIKPNLVIEDRDDDLPIE